MSLLMDALKRAEQEKKDAAKRLSSEDELSVTRKEQLGEITDSHPIVNNEPEPASPTEIAADMTYHTTSMDLSLEPLEASDRNPLIHKRPAEKLMVETIAEAEDREMNLDITPERLSLKSDFADVGRQPAVDADQTQQVKLVTQENKLVNDLDQTFLNVSLEQSMTAGLYEDTIQGEAIKPADLNHSYDETLPGVPAAQLARDIGTHDQPTPVAAQTLFTATNTITKPSTGFRWLLISLGVLAIGSALVAYYYFITPVSRNIPSPLVAKGVETILSSQDIQTLAQTSNNTTAGPTASAVLPTDVTNVAPESGGTEPPTVPADAPTAAPVVATEAPTSAETVVNEPPPAPPAPAQIATASSESDRLPAVIVPPASLVRISRNMNTSSGSQLINEAFSAWQQGDYARANERYQLAYEQSPDNRDVLLGLAAIATRNGDTVRALQFYMRLVALNPLDNVARAALIGLQPGEDVSGSISAIKSMLYDSPEQASLYFTLGKLYAVQSKWSEAQQAFFDAYRLDSANPDYAFNLAVSLDRMDQPESALDYYTVALGLSETSQAGFNRTAVADRIQTLETRE
jgi:Flp pilus assembly protein TadD